MYKTQCTNEQISLNSNDGSAFYIGSNVPAQSSELADGTSRVTHNLASKLISGELGGVVQGTVENVQNTFVHEVQGHRLLGAPGDGPGHAKAYEVQINHPTFKNTTSAFQSAMREMFQEYKKMKR
jgi:hypothetical protein